MKSKEEILKNHTGHAHGLMDASVFNAMEEFACQFIPKWVKVSDKAPSDCVGYWVYTTDSEVCRMLFIQDPEDINKSEWVFGGEDYSQYNEITHYAEIIEPEPPLI